MRERMNNRSSVQPRRGRRGDARDPGSARRPAGALPRLDTTAERVRDVLADNAMVERLARNFKALGDPTRSKLVLALSLSELCVSDLAHALGASLSATSHQLRILRDLDMVRVRRDGKSQLYTLNEAAFGLCSPRVCRAWAGTLPRPRAGSGRR
jgi:DNA-binding transcriptional ArsR family regulator